MTLFSILTDLVGIVIAAAIFSEMPYIFEHVCQSKTHGYRTCILTNGRNFAHLLRCFYIVLCIFLRVYNKVFYTTFCVFALLHLCLFISLGLSFRPCYLMKLSPHDVFYLLSKYVHGIRGYPVGIRYITNIILSTTEYSKCFVVVSLPI